MDDSSYRSNWIRLSSLLVQAGDPQISQDPACPDLLAIGWKPHPQQQHPTPCAVLDSVFLSQHVCALCERDGGKMWASHHPGDWDDEPEFA